MDGTLWLNLGDAYAGSSKGAWKEKNKQKHVYVPDPDSKENKIDNVPIGLKPKDLIGLPWRVLLLYRLMVGIYDKILFGINQTQCLTAYEFGRQSHMNIFFF